MLKRYGLMNHLHVHIVLLVVSVILFSGCAGLKTGDKKSFYPEYYASKRLDNNDIMKLRSYMASIDPKISDPSTLILGINYLRHGDKNFGRALIEKSYKSPSLDEEMKIFGKIWKMESLLTENKNKEAKDLKNEIENMEKTPLYTRALTVYCISIGRPLVDGDNPFVCIKERFQEPEKEILFTQDVKLPEFKDKSDSNENSMTYDEYIKAIGGESSHEIEESYTDTAEIDIIGSDVMSDLVQGMIFGINNLKSMFTINSITSESERKNTIAVYGDKSIVAVGNNLISLDIDWENFNNTVRRMPNVDKHNTIIICASNDKMPYAKSLSEKFKKEKTKVTLLNYNKNIFQQQLRQELSKHKNIETIDGEKVETYNPALIIGVGDEEEIIDFIAVARFLQESKEQEILLMLSSLTPSLLTGDYGQYFKNISIATPMGLINDTKYVEVEAPFKVYFGKDMAYKNVIGYDIIVYLLTQLQPQMGQEFISSKEGFVDNKAYRSVLLYEIDNRLKAMQKQYDLVDIYDEEPYGIGDEIINIDTN